MSNPDHDVCGQIAELWIYPVKSCAGIKLERARLLAHGLQWDRRWLVADLAGDFLTQRSHPRMAWIQPSITEHALVLDFPGMPSLSLPLQAGPQARKRCARVWRDELQAWNLGANAAAATQWLSTALNTPCQLLCVDESQPRQASEKWVGDAQVPVHFADGFPLLLLSTAAMDELNQRLVATGMSPVDARRFRPNILIAGIAAHDEDRVQALELELESEPGQSDGPGVVLHPCKPCIRCPIPDIDPETAESSTSVSDAIVQYRQDARVDGAITFGMNAIVSGLPQTAAAGVDLMVGQRLSGDLQFA